MKGLFLRIFLLVPWLMLIWLISEGISGSVDGTLVFFLLFILIPGAIVLNLITVIAFQGYTALQIIRRFQKSRDVGNAKLESENYADLPWWHPKRWF